MSAHEQGAAAQTRHSRRRHTCPNTFHPPRARNIPAHALASPRLAVADTRSDTSSPSCLTPAPSMSSSQSSWRHVDDVRRQRP
eukprot:5156035-Prymnesium_polylepis.1